ncbi:MAG: hypothetical protein EBR73_16775, partial [Rhodobacteraceae bacterium]|nr:hypothetical protein [Paracoccaceae bacterium]
SRRRAGDSLRLELGKCRLLRHGLSWRNRLTRCPAKDIGRPNLPFALVAPITGAGQRLAAKQYAAVSL